MRIYLAGIGWVPDKPAGNRLRWSYPTWSLDEKRHFLGLPETIIVERAPVGEDIKYQTLLGASSVMPLSWWDHYGIIKLTGFLPLIHKLPSPVQVVSFTYKGPTTGFIVVDTENNIAVSYRMLNNGDFVYLQASAMDMFFFLTYPSVELQNFSTLDLFKDRSLEWETLAEIPVRDALKAKYEDVAKRYDIPATLSKEQWEELVDLVNKAQLSSPTFPPKDEPEPWKTLDLAMGVRWEYAMICGYGFFDGPRSQTSPLDKIYSDKLLRGVPPQAYAYRVRDAMGRIKPSNVVVCPNWLVAPLVPPSIPTYVSPEVRLTATGTFEATYGLKWSQFDPYALGVEFEEEISSSPSLVGSTRITESFENRSRRPQETLLQGEIARSLEVPFHDVTIRSRCRATDGWDRVSAYSRWNPATPLALSHNPPAPPLESARYDAGTAHIFRQIGDPLLPDWNPDIIVQKASGKLFIYRKDTSKSPRVENVNVSAPLLVEGHLYKTTASVPNPSDFIGGYLIAGNIKASITDISGSDFFFQVPDEGGGSVTLFSTGPAKLQQDSKHESLWIKVAKFSVIGLPNELVFTDPVAGPTDQADVLSYYARLSYFGKLGPASNIVHAIRVPPTPVVPPPFTVELLGIDFYMRAMVKIQFTNPVTEGQYTVWWADGTFDSSQFGLQAVPGEYRAQQAQNQLFLYDILSLPIPNKVNRTVTIGVQRVNVGGGQSNFLTVQITLPAP